MSLHYLHRLRPLFSLHSPTAPSSLSRTKHPAVRVRRHMHASSSFPTESATQPPPTRPTNTTRRSQRPHPHPHPHPHPRPPPKPTTTTTPTAPLLTTLATLIILAHLTRTHLRPTEGASMLPTIPLAGAGIDSGVAPYILINPWKARGRHVRVGDVVAAAHPLRPGEGVVKRVVGLPGDWVACGVVVAAEDEDEEGGRGADSGGEDRWGDSRGEDGEEVEEVEEDGEVVVVRRRKKEGMIRIPAGHCWLAGDNSLDSFDSRHYGPVSLALVTGKVEAVVWWEGWKLHWERLRNGIEAVD